MSTENPSSATYSTPDKKSLFSQLKSFDKSRLHKTDTVVTTADGRSLVESKNDEGRTVVTQTNSGTYGFVPSVVEDLQVGEILPGLIMGTLFIVRQSNDISHISCLWCETFL